MSFPWSFLKVKYISSPGREQMFTMLWVGKQMVRLGDKHDMESSGPQIHKSVTPSVDAGLDGLKWVYSYSQEQG